MKNRFSSLLRLLAVLAAAAPLAVPAQVTFTIHATVSFGSAGYSAHAPVDFSFVLNDFAPATPAGEVVASPADANWEENTTSDPFLWSSVSGSGLSGAWQRPATDASSPASSIQLLSEDSGTSLSLVAGTDSSPGNDTGLIANGSGVSLLSFSATFNDLDFAIPGSTPLPDPTVYFSAYVGDYAVNHSNGGQLTLANSGLVLFDVTGLTISAASAVPEPATVALLAGALALVAAALFRLRRTVSAPRAASSTSD